MFVFVCPIIALANLWYYFVVVESRVELLLASERGGLDAADELRFWSTERSSNDINKFYNREVKPIPGASRLPPRALLFRVSQHQGAGYKELIGG